MKHYSWEEFYANYEDWQPGELWANTFGLKEFGPSNQVADVICLMECYDDDAGTDHATKFAERFYESGSKFTPDDLIDMCLSIDEKLLNRLAEDTAVPFNREQLEDAYSFLEEDVFERISKKVGIDIFDDFEDEDPVDEFDDRDFGDDEYFEEEPDEEDFDDDEDFEDDEEEAFDEEWDEPEPLTRREKFAAAATGFALGALLSGKKVGHPGHCTGDCENCPPHYGYRYGRWYYGHDHQYGCEFGGNKGSGEMD